MGSHPTLSATIYPLNPFKLVRYGDSMSFSYLFHAQLLKINGPRTSWPLCPAAPQSRQYGGPGTFVGDGPARPVIPSTSLLSTQRSVTRASPVCSSSPPEIPSAFSRWFESRVPAPRTTSLPVAWLGHCTSPPACWRSGTLVYGAESCRFREEEPDHFNPEERVERVLLDNLTASHQLLVDAGLVADAAQALLVQAMFVARVVPLAGRARNPRFRLSSRCGRCDRPALFLLRPERLAPAARGRGPRGPDAGEPAHCGPNSGTGRSGSLMITAAASLGSDLAWAVPACRSWPPSGPRTRCSAGPGASWHGRGRIRDVARNAPPGCRRSIHSSCGGHRRIPRGGTPGFRAPCRWWAPRVGCATAACILKAHCLPPVPERPTAWQTLLPSPLGCHRGRRRLHHGGLDGYEPGHLTRSARSTGPVAAGRFWAPRRIPTPLHAAAGPYARLRRSRAPRTTSGVNLRSRCEVEPSRARAPQ